MNICLFFLHNNYDYEVTIMLKDIDKVVEKLKKDTNNNGDIIYREKYINKQKIYVIYNEPLCSSEMISNFIIRSLDFIDNKYKRKVDIVSVIKNDINNFKVKEASTYKDVCFYLHNAFTIILVEGSDVALAMENKGALARGINKPSTENTLRGPMDAFVENIQINLGLIRRRIKDNRLWSKEYFLGRYTKTKINILYVDGVAKKEIVKQVDKLIKKIDIDGVINLGTIKNFIQKENKSAFPTMITTERPDHVCQALLKGKIAIVMDNCPFVLILPTVFSDFFLSLEDSANQSINISFTRIVRYIAFFITVLTPGIYIAITTYNQEMLPTELLISFAGQRSSVPFPAFFEALLMTLSFEILRESDLRIPSSSSSALSIVGALILGEAAVNAGIVSPIMIIVVSITMISSLLFIEPDFINGIRWWRLFFMLGGSFMGIIGIVLVFIAFMIKIASINSFGKPYLMPFAPTSVEGLKNSVIRFPTRKLNKREKYLSDNTYRMGGSKK